MSAIVPTQISAQIVAQPLLNEQTKKILPQNPSLEKDRELKKNIDQKIKTLKDEQRQAAEELLKVRKELKELQQQVKIKNDRYSKPEENMQKFIKIERELKENSEKLKALKEEAEKLFKNQ